jgi:signal peptidase I
VASIVSPSPPLPVHAFVGLEDERVLTRVSPVRMVAMPPDNRTTSGTPAFTPAVFIPAELPDHGEERAVPVVTTTSMHRDEPAFTRFRNEVVAWLKTLISAAVYATIIVTFGFQVARVQGESLRPTLNDHDRLIVNKLVYLWHDPQYGDVVMHYWPDDPRKTFVKRIVAVEGDTIRSAAGRIYRNGALLDESFISPQFRMDDTWGPIAVKRGYYFVLGDHRNDSSDSRAWGEVPKKYIIGKIQLRWWPLNDARFFERP